MCFYFKSIIAFIQRSITPQQCRPPPEDRPQNSGANYHSLCQTTQSCPTCEQRIPHVPRARCQIRPQPHEVTSSDSRSSVFLTLTDAELRDVVDNTSGFQVTHIMSKTENSLLFVASVKSKGTQVAHLNPRGLPSHHGPNPAVRPGTGCRCRLP